MKKILVLLLTLLLISAFSLTSLGASVSVATELTQVRSYYTEKDQLSLFEETLAMASMGMLPGKTAFLPEKDGTAGGVAKRILAVTAIGEIPEDDPDLAALKEFQDSDGSFGSVESHCLSMLALASRKEVYHSAKAYQWLMQQQGENGSFSDSPKITALAVSALSLSQNQEELEAVTKAVTYLINYKADNSTCAGRSSALPTAEKTPPPQETENCWKPCSPIKALRIIPFTAPRVTIPPTDKPRSWR